MSDATRNEDGFNLAEPRTVLGQLQRGRGAGWVAAVRSPDGRELLRSCLAHDPRWDWQVEDRADYYARLALALNLTGEDIDPDEVAADDETHALGINVLGRLAVRGDEHAVERLRRELERPGEKWSVLSELGDVPNGRGIEGVDAILVRSCDASELAELIEDMDTRHLPWETWAQRHPAISAARSQAKELRSASRPRSVPPEADAPVDALLGFEWSGAIPKRVVRRLAETREASEVRALREAATGPWGPARMLALRALAERRDPAAIHTAAEVFNRNVIGAERASAFRYFLALDASVIVPLARGWLDLEDDRSRVAAATMALHSTPDDLPLIRSAFSRAWSAHSMYEICDLVDALARLPSVGPHSELRVVFTDVEYSYARRRAAVALAATDPEFPTTFAAECLWDCEEETRLIGATTVDGSVADARSGLVQLAEDPFEAEDVRDVARERIQR